MTTSHAKAVGSEAERTVARIVGGSRVGMDGGPIDVIVGDYLALQVKSLRTMPSMTEVRKYLDAIPQTHRLRGAVVQDRPGKGVRSRRTITFDLDEWAEWHAMSIAVAERLA